MNEPAFVGALHKADEQGFRRLLTDANKAHKEGYQLVTVVVVGGQLGSVYRRTSGGSMSEGNSFFE